MAPEGVLKGAGGGDGGLFAGITARYLAQAATELPGADAARDAARTIVLASAKAAWDNRADVDGLPLFSAFWDRTAEVPQAGGASAAAVDGAVFESVCPERDLSVQVSGWMLMEAAYAVTKSG
jgi:predicted alpha-1,6-mannanase (GH76 family)